MALVLAAGFGAVAYTAHVVASRPFKGYAAEEMFFTISPGDASGAIAERLERRGVIESARLFLAALVVRRETGRLQAGEYRFGTELSLFDVIDRLVAGNVYYRTVTIPEGLNLWETAHLLSERGLGDTNELEVAFSRGTLVGSLDPAAENLEGYLFPETYRFPRNPKADEIAQALVSRFVDVFDERRRRKAEELGLGVREVVTFASVVEKETGQSEERPLIASVFWNRLGLRMPLQSDPTVIYDLKRQGDYDGNLRRTHLKMNSPYNTYRREGLPPGPIASPGQDAIDAVLNPAQSKYLYFVSKNDGSHHFSTSLQEHNRAVRKYQVEYFRKRRQHRKRQAAS